MTAIGIDLGTTYSAVAVSSDGRTARVLPTSDGNATTPSIIFFPDMVSGGQEEPLVGTMAKNSYSQAPFNTISLVKRQMGNPAYKYVSPNGNTFGPEELSGIILRHIKQYAETDLGEAVTDAVITVPAYFDDARRTATKQAGQLAGLNVLGLLNEPTAAAIAFGLASNSRGRVLVYDLGGGTFDITLMDISGGDLSETASLRALATDGDPFLGGADWDAKLRDLMVADLESQGAAISDEDDCLQNELMEKAEILKKGLSVVEQSQAIFTIDGKTYRVKVSREQFESATTVLVRRTKERLDGLITTAGVPWNSIDQFLLVGGSTFMPMIRRMAEELWGKPVPQSVDPNVAVADGAAIYAHYLATGLANPASSTDGAATSPIKIQDITSQSLGVVARHEITKNLYNSIIIARNTPIPAKRSETYTTICDNQTAINLQVTEGNDEDLDYVAMVAEQEFPIPPYPEGSPVQVTIAYDIDQTVYVEITDLVANRSLGNLTIDRQANMDKDQLTLAKARMDTFAVDGTPVAPAPSDTEKTAAYWDFLGIEPTPNREDIQLAIARTRDVWQRRASVGGTAADDANNKLLYLNEIAQALLSQ